MDIWVTGIVMAGLGYWAAHIRLTAKRDGILTLLTQAEGILAKIASDREEVTKQLDEAIALTDKASWLAIEADRSRVNEDDKRTTV